MRIPRPDILALRDRIQAILRDAGGFPISTDAICEALGDRTIVMSAHPMCRSCTCPPIERTVWAGAWKPDVYRALCQWERQGTVVKTSVPRQRSVYWSLADIAREGACEVPGCPTSEGHTTAEHLDGAVAERRPA